MLDSNNTVALAFKNVILLLLKQHKANFNLIHNKVRM